MELHFAHETQAMLVRPLSLHLFLAAGVMHFSSVRACFCSIPQIVFVLAAAPRPPLKRGGGCRTRRRQRRAPRPKCVGSIRRCSRGARRRRPK